VRRNPELAAPRNISITFWQGLVPPLCSFAMWTLNGIAFWMFVRSLAPLPLDVLPSFIAINAAAYFIGYVSFITPSGLGFREASLAFLLSAYFPPPVAVAIAFMARLWSIAGEFLGVSIAMWLRPRQETQANAGPFDSAQGGQRTADGLTLETMEGMPTATEPLSSSPPNLVK
jgi:hypothetical protein